jgi:hypothetical protein
MVATGPLRTWPPPKGALLLVGMETRAVRTQHKVAGANSTEIRMLQGGSKNGVRGLHMDLEMLPDAGNFRRFRAGRYLQNRR